MSKTAKALQILEAKLREKKLLEHEDETLVDEITQDGIDALIEAMQEFSVQELSAFKERLNTKIDIQIRVGIDNSAPNNEIDLLQNIKKLIDQTT